jgi:Ca2+-binding EF-hand superfamily protein
VDRSGYLSSEEIAAVIKDVFFSKGSNREVTEQDIRTVMSTMDRNKDGKISRD